MLSNRFGKPKKCEGTFIWMRILALETVQTPPHGVGVGRGNLVNLPSSAIELLNPSFPTCTIQIQTYSYWQPKRSMQLNSMHNLRKTSCTCAWTACELVSNDLIFNRHFLTRSPSMTSATFRNLWSFLIGTASNSRKKWMLWIVLLFGVNQDPRQRESRESPANRSGCAVNPESRQCKCQGKGPSTKFWMARSRLYRSRVLQLNTSFTACF